METNRGYVYVMINTAYGEGVVKIGKTTKSPEERAKELSSATGVATPFIVVYKREFNNCHVAERMIHGILEDKGCRLNSNREFFVISITEAIDLIMQIPNDVDSYDSSYENEEFVVNDQVDSNDDLAQQYYELARDFANGTNDTFQDYDKALECYERSVSLGKTDALYDIGMIYMYAKENTDKALQALHAATKYGCWKAYCILGEIYGDKKSRYYNQINSDLAWRKYLEYIKTHNDELDAWDWNIEGVGRNIVMRLYDLIGYNYDIPSIMDEVVFHNRSYVKEAFEKQLDYYEANGYEILINPMKERVGTYLDSIEEKFLLSPSVGDKLGENYYTLAEKYHYGNDGYDKNEYKALRYYKESAKLGYHIAHVSIGKWWYTTNQDRNRLDKAYREFYNAVYEKLSNEGYLMSDEEKRLTLEAFLDVFNFSANNDVKDILHDYYFMMAISLGFSDFLCKKMEEVNKLAEEVSANPYDESVDYSSLSWEEKHLNTKALIASIDYKLKLGIVTNVTEMVKSFIQDFQHRNTDVNPRFYQLEVDLS